MKNCTRIDQSATVTLEPLMQDAQLDDEDWSSGLVASLGTKMILLEAYYHHRIKLWVVVTRGRGDRKVTHHKDMDSATRYIMGAAHVLRGMGFRCQPMTAL